MHQVGYLQRLYQDAWSTEHKKRVVQFVTPKLPTAEAQIQSGICVSQRENKASYCQELYCFLAHHHLCDNVTKYCMCNRKDQLAHLL